MSKTTSLSLTLILGLVCVLQSCGGGGEAATRENMILWGQALKFHVTTSHKSNYTFPTELMGVEPDLRQGLEPIDGWGNPFVYRRWRDDRYDLISTGANGIPGDDDDIVMANGKFLEPSVVYGERPYQAG